MSVDDNDMNKEEEVKEVGDAMDEKSPMCRYLQAVYHGLKSETSSASPAMEKWLLKFLKENDWRIPAHRAAFLCKK
jgi:hypothetical protein